ncbi:LPS translocon maturation chaperone LptM [Macromonas nakdongensis]|uniref:LPS translocon maturation chaperone LptM n=1 Tax=Macromonas nakdongensis TaxID=1843082 RepID=UPI0034E29D1A
MFTFRQILGRRSATTPDAALDRAAAVGMWGRGGCAAALALALAACGQKGPLYLPAPTTPTAAVPDASRTPTPQPDATAPRRP